MIQAGFFSLFNFVANNKWAQIALTGGLIVFLYLANNANQRRIGRGQERNRAAEKARKVQAKIKKDQHEKSEKVAAARRDAPRGVRRADQLSDSTASILFGTDGDRQ